MRFVGFGESSLNLELLAYVVTADWNEFLAIQEDIHLRIVEVVAASGTGIAFPSQTLHFGRDGGTDLDKLAAAMAQVKQWRENGKLPFPEFDLEFRRAYLHTISP